MNSSHAQRLFGRKPRNNLPIASSLMKLQLQTDVLERKERNNEKQARYYNRSAKDLPELSVGKGQKAAVLERVGIWSYKVLQKNCIQLRKRNNHSVKQVMSMNQVAMWAKQICVPNETIPTTSGSSQPTLVSSGDNSIVTSKNLRRSQRQRRQPTYLKDYTLK